MQYFMIDYSVTVTNLRGVSTISSYDRIKEKVNRGRV